MYDYCISLECNGDLTLGVGFLVGFRSPRRWILGQTRHLKPGCRKWCPRFWTRRPCLRRADGRRCGSCTPPRALSKLRSQEGLHVESVGGVPAVQVDALDGRRLEIEIVGRDDEHHTVIRREIEDPIGPRQVDHGVAEVPDIPGRDSASGSPPPASFRPSAAKDTAIMCSGGARQIPKRPDDACGGVKTS